MFNFFLFQWFHSFWLWFTDLIPWIRKKGDHRMRAFNKKRMFSGSGHPGPIIPWQENKKNENTSTDNKARVYHVEEAEELERDKGAAITPDEPKDVDIERLDKDDTEPPKSGYERVRVIGFAQEIGEWTRRVLQNVKARFSDLEIDTDEQQSIGYWTAFVRLSKRNERKREWREMIDTERYQDHLKHQNREKSRKRGQDPNNRGL